MTFENHFTGQDLIEMGFTPGPHFGPLLKNINIALDANKHKGQDAVDEAILGVIAEFKAAFEKEKAEREARLVPLLDTPIEAVFNITAEYEDEQTNVEAVRKTMEVLGRTPTLVATAVMPDACPAGSIPVGGVAGARNAIHPGWHSADICCSMMATNLGDVDPKMALDIAFEISHFGPGGRPRHQEAKINPELMEMLSQNNIFLKDKKTQSKARSDLFTCGDGNHFVFVGKSQKTGSVWIVTHFGSRGFGAQIYKSGMAVAERFRQEICPELDKGNAWIPYDTDEGRQYWDALQIVRAWTKENHTVLHNMVMAKMNIDALHRRWNEHNFVFKDGDVFWHGKGATPIHNGFLPDTDGTQIVPMNMAQPILFVKGKRNDRNLGFAPHGAGRNLSRTQHKRRMTGETNEKIFARETAGIDARFHSGIIDISELPSAYKDADKVQTEMERFGLARVVDRIQPYGAIMAGDQQTFWKNKKKK